MQQCSILNLKLYFCHQDDKELFDNQKRMQIVEIRTVAKSLPPLR